MRKTRKRPVLLNTSYGLRGVLSYGGFAAADTSQKTYVFVLLNHVLRANQASYVGGKERARNLLSDAPENDSVAARGAELRPFEGPRVPQHDLICS